MKRWALVKVKDPTLYHGKPWLLKIAFGMITDRKFPNGKGPGKPEFCKITWTRPRWQRMLRDYMWFPREELEEYRHEANADSSVR